MLATCHTIRRNMIDHAPTLKFRGLVNRLSGVHHFTKAAALLSWSISIIGEGLSSIVGSRRFSVFSRSFRSSSWDLHGFTMGLPRFWMQTNWISSENLQPGGYAGARSRKMPLRCSECGESPNSTSLRFTFFFRSSACFFFFFWGVPVSNFPSQMRLGAAVLRY